MAGEADIGLRRGLLDGIRCLMAVMAVGAADFVTGVCPRVPAEADIILVAVQAHAVLFFDWRCRIRTEPDYRRSLLAAPNATGVCSAGTVTGFALQLAFAERSCRVRRYRVVGAEHGERHLVLVTGEAGIRALAAVFGFLALCRRHGRQQESGKKHNLYLQFHTNHPLTDLVEKKRANAMRFFHV
jgi:hypothetical protein